MADEDLLDEPLPTEPDDEDPEDTPEDGEEGNDDEPGEEIPTEPEEPEIPIADSILLSIKKLLGIGPEHESFDIDIVMHINSVFFTLNQLGVGPDVFFQIKGKENLWTEFIGENTHLEMIKTYIFYKVKLIWDPPQNSALIASMERIIAEMEWRLNFDAELRRSLAPVELPVEEEPPTEEPIEPPVEEEPSDEPVDDVPTDENPDDSIDDDPVDEPEEPNEDRPTDDTSEEPEDEESEGDTDDTDTTE